MKEIQEQQARLEQEKCGGFERIYPLNLEQISEQYQKVVSSPLSTAEQKSQAQQVYNKHMQRQNIFHEILLTVSNAEHEKAARQMQKI